MLFCKYSDFIEISIIFEEKFELCTPYIIYASEVHWAFLP